MPKFQTQPVDESFFETAPFKLTETYKVNKSAADVWAELTVDNPLSWCKLLKDIEWTSPRPFGVGTTRRVRTVASASILNEHFFIWDEGKRMSFYAVTANAPLFKHFAEDYVVVPTSGTTCDFTWTIAAEPHPAARITNPVNRIVLGTLLSDTRKHFAA